MSSTWSSVESSIRESIRESPAGLKAFGGFCVVVTFADLVFLHGAWGAAVVPHTGWVPSMVYMFGVVMTLAAMSGRTRWQLYCLTGILVFFMVVGAGQMVGRIGVLESNAYLRVSWFRPIWVLLVPGVWLAVLWSRPVREFLSLPGRPGTFTSENS